MDVRNGDDETDNGLGLQSLPAYLVQSYDVSTTPPKAGCNTCEYLETIEASE